MADMRKEDENSSRNNKGKGKGTEAYSGGERSGMAVMRPGNDASAPQGQDAFAQARARGVVDNAREMGGNAITVTIYADGFTVNDGPLRPLSDPKNKKFLDDIQSGQLPQELKKEDPNETVELAVQDKRPAKYEKPSSSSINAAPTSLTNPIKPGQADLTQGSTAGPTATGAGEVNIDRSKPVTTIMIRFGDGRRQTQEFNEDAIVNELFEFVASCVGTSEFSLIEGFPPKPILDKSKTIKEAGLMKGSISVKN